MRSINEAADEPSSHGRKCIYFDDNVPSEADAGLRVVTSAPNDDFHSLLNQQDKHRVNARFLDHELFLGIQAQLPSTVISWKDIPDWVSRFVDSYQTACQVATRYYQLVHPWLPIVSKKKVFDHLLSSLVPLRSDSVFLIMCMNLLIQDLEGEDPVTPAYKATVRFLRESEMGGVTSLEMLQGCILLAVYEFGHAVYPSARVSMSTTQEHARILELNWSESTWSKAGISSWVDREERKRTWWAVFLLERSNISNKVSSTLLNLGRN